MNAMKIKQAIPNLITLVNLFCGSLAILAILNTQYYTAFWLLFIGGWADFFDGMVARALEVHSNLGKELDSLADMVSFGLVPGVIVYHLLCLGYDASSGIPCEGICWPATPGFIVTLFSAWRLAKFNIDQRESNDFFGLATPANTVFFCGLMLIYAGNIFGAAELMTNPYFLIPVSIAFSLLLVSEIIMFSFKMDKFQWKGNEIKFVFTLLSVISAIIWREASFSIIIATYVVLSLGLHFFKQK